MTEVRDIALIAGFIALTLLALMALAAVTIAGYITFRIVRGLRRLHDGRLEPAVERLSARLRERGEQGPMSAAEVAGQLFRSVRLLRAVRRRKRKRRRARFAFLRA